MEQGETAPGFELQGSDGKIHRLSDHLGKRMVVLAWYPKAFTPGWTIECKSLRESGDRIREFEAAIYAVGIDGPETNRKFAESLDLDYPILSDPTKQTARAYGVARMFGMYAARHTFYIGVDGKIAWIDRKVRPNSAGADLIERLERLGVPRR